MLVCLFACMCASLSIFVYACLRVSIRARVRVCVRAYGRAYVRACVCVCVRAVRSLLDSFRSRFTPRQFDRAPSTRDTKPFRRFNIANNIWRVHYARRLALPSAPLPRRQPSRRVTSTTTRSDAYDTAFPSR